jgi:hypothetical protein
MGVVGVSMFYVRYAMHADQFSNTKLFAPKKPAEEPTKEKRLGLILDILRDPSNPIHRDPFLPTK